MWPALNRRATTESRSARSGGVGTLPLVDGASHPIKTMWSLGTELPALVTVGPMKSGVQSKVLVVG